ncbi:MAG: DUF5036 family protein [Muribaculaceae bacterium]|nr:DUF5036 family protein [Muribaculaceae bacterium]
MKKFFAIALTMLLVVCAGCGKDDPSGDNPQTPDRPVVPPTQTVDDPEGTIRLSMRNANNGDTRLSALRIDNADNFQVDGYNKIVDIGEVKGLGNVSYIPRIGWANRVSVVPGHGYVMAEYSPYGGEAKFTRIYVMEWMTASVSGGVIGAEIKYQQPFNGLDETIRVDKVNLTLPSEGGAAAVKIENQYFTPFAVELKSGTLEYRVSRGASGDVPFIYDGILVECGKSYAVQQQSSVFTITTSYGRSIELTVTQVPEGEYLELSASQISFRHDGAADHNDKVDVFTNIVFSDIAIDKSDSWFETVLENSEKSAAPAFKTIEGSPASKATVDYLQTSSLRFVVNPNVDANSRSGHVTLRYKGLERNIEIKQDGVATMPEFKDIEVGVGGCRDMLCDYDAGSIRAEEITFNVDEGCDWCSAEAYGRRIKVNATRNTSSEMRSVEVIAMAYGEECGKFNIVQKGIETEAVFDDVEFSVEEGCRTVNFDGGDYDASKITFSVSEEDAQWCSVTKLSDKSYKVTVSRNLEMSSRTATISAVFEGKVLARFKVSQKGIERLPDLEEQYTFGAQKDRQMEIIVDNGDCLAELIDYKLDDEIFELTVSARGQKTAVVLTAKSNYYERSRESMLHVLYRGEEIKTSRLVQEAAVYQPTEVFVDRDGGIYNVYLGYGFDFSATSSSSFVTTQLENGTMTLRIESTSSDRTARITFDGISLVINVRQTQYKKGDKITISGRSATILTLQTGVRLDGWAAGDGSVYLILPGPYVWSTENAMLYCSETDGRQNREIIKSIPGWEKLYPAFAAVDALNNDSKVDWYIPAIDEVREIKGYGYKTEVGWTSSVRANNNTQAVVAMGGYDRPIAAGYYYRNIGMPVISLSHYNFFDF